MRFAYADPPYVGKARKHYGPDAREVNQRVLIGTLVREYPDGWALSCSSPSLQLLLPMCPPDVRVLAWVKPFVPYMKGVGVAYGWEPVILRGGRKRTREDGTVNDWARIPATMQQGLVGAKPEAFCYWLFKVLNARAGDQLDDLFPGTNAVGRAWAAWQHQPALEVPLEHNQERLPADCSAG